MAIFFFCVSDKLYTREGKTWRFPFGRELTTCWRLFKWRGGLACATVNKLKCWEVQRASSAPSKAAPTWHTAFDVLAKFVFSTATTLTQLYTNSLTHTRKHTGAQMHAMKSHLRNRCGFTQITHNIDINAYGSTLHNDCMGATFPSDASINIILNLNRVAILGLRSNATGN